MKLKKSFSSISSIFHLTGTIILLSCFIFLIPLIIAFSFNEKEVMKTFFYTFILMITTGFLLTRLFKEGRIYYLQSLIICAISWILISFFVAIPIYRSIAGISFVNAFFEAVSATTTVGITIIPDLGIIPKTILFWRALVEWFGGIGILTLFITITYKSNGAYFQLFAAETSKIETSRPTPNIINTIYILGSIYIGLTLLNIFILKFLGLSFFDALCHGLTNISTGGFSTHNANIYYFEMKGYKHFITIEYVIIIFMILGSINFLILYKIFTFKFKEVKNNIEFKYYIGFLFLFTIVILFGKFIEIYKQSNYRNFLFFIKNINFSQFEKIFRHIFFTVVSINSTTGYTTYNITNIFFPSVSKTLIIIMMFIGGSVGSTSGGLKVIRVVVLLKMFKTQIKKIRLPRYAISEIVIDKKIFPDQELKKIFAIIIGWLIIIFTGAIITQLFTSMNSLKAVTTMVSLLGNVGPIYIDPIDISFMPIIVKFVYIFAMFAGRLELLPFLIIFSAKAWKGY